MPESVTESEPDPLTGPGTEADTEDDTIATQQERKDGAPSPEAPEATFGAGIRLLHSFQFRDFRWLWLGNTFSGASTWIQQTTMGWLVYDLTGSGAILGAINSLGNLPSLATAPLAGVAADRYSRNSVVAVSQALALLNAMFIAIVILLGVLHVWYLFVFAIVAGSLNAINMPARQAIVPDVVPREVVPNAIALNNTAMNVTRTLGPLVAGALIVAFGPAENFMLQALAYLGVVVAILNVRRIPPPLSSQGRSFRRDLKEGYRWALTNPDARLLLLMMVLYPTFVIPVHLALMPIFAEDVFHTDAGGLGLLLGSLGVGGFFGAVLAAALNQVDRRGLLQLAGLFVVSGFLVLFGVIGGLTGNLWIGVGLLVLSGTGGSLFLTTNQTVLQLLAPAHLRGRVTGLLNINPICQSVGVIVTGTAADFFGAATMAAISGGIMFSIGLAVLIFSPRERNLRLSRLGHEVAHS